MSFWLQPDWSGGDHLRSGAEPFWMLSPKRHSFVCEHGTFAPNCPSCHKVDVVRQEVVIAGIRHTYKEIRAARLT